MNSKNAHLDLIYVDWEELKERTKNFSVIKVIWLCCFVLTVCLLLFILCSGAVFMY